MTTPNEINISFSLKGISYDFSLQKESTNSLSAESIVIAGHNYKLIANPTESSVIQEVLRATSLEHLTSSKDLYNRIKRTLASPQFSDRINQIGVKSLRSEVASSIETERPIDQTTRMNAIFQHSLAAQFKDYQTFTTFGKAETIAIVGHSTAGKSTLIRAYLQKHSGTIEEGSDKVIREEFVKQVGRQFPNELAIIKACIEDSESDVILWNAILTIEVHPKFKENVVQDDIHKFTTATKKIRKEIVFQLSETHIDAIMLDKALNNSQRGKTTIFDVLQIDGVFRQCISKNVKLPFRIALAYCPFQKLAERQRIRNETAINTNNPSEVRQGIFLFDQFANLFGPKKNADDLVIETLTRDLVVQTIKQGFSEEVAYHKKNSQDYEKWIKSLKGKFGSELAEEDLISKEMDDQLNHLLEKLGFTSAETQTVQLTPRIQNYHYLLDLDVLKPDQAAEILSKGARSYHFV